MRSSARTDETATNYPSYCLALVVAATVLSLLSHAAPSHWIPAPGVPLRPVRAEGVGRTIEPDSIAGKWAAPSALPHKTVMDEVRGAAWRGAARGARSPRRLTLSRAPPPGL
jgi:hypothetical protein